MAELMRGRGDHARPRALGVLALLGAACSSDARLLFDPPAGWTSALFVARVGSDVLVTAHRANDPLRLPLEDTWSAVEIYFYAQSLDELSLAEGAQSLVREGEAGREAPRAELGGLSSVRVDGAWTEPIAVGDAPTGFRLPPLPSDCERLKIRTIPIPESIPIDVGRILATGPDMALAFGHSGSTPQIVAVGADGSVVDRTVPIPDLNVASVVTDGVDAWVSDTEARLHRLGLDGTLEESSTTTIGRELVVGGGRRVYVRQGRRLARVEPGTARATRLGAITFPEDTTAIAVHDELRMMAIVGRGVQLYEGATWRAQSLELGGLPPIAIAIDERAALVSTSNAVWERVLGGDWRQIRTGGDGQRYGMTSLGRGGIATHGVLGFFEVLWPSHIDGWCGVPTGTIRTFYFASADPSGAAIFSGVRRAGDMMPSYLIRIELPQD